MVNNSRRLDKLEKFVSDPYLLYLANKNMFKLKKEKTIPPISTKRITTTSKQ
jgi:hypothetical protein